jgi:hypothetical protein
MIDAAKRSSLLVDLAKCALYLMGETWKRAVETLTEAAKDQLPAATLKHLLVVQLSSATNGTRICFPYPSKEAEATVALKSIEACAVAASQIWDM